ncbi:TlpA family protein disulfide reductase [Marinicella meishanensis]|uniref:TlpA family protein disulfide reductase n=1 Tax=Marinicella meishanensis TaxID=2873263 RepID=UPI001CBCAD8F|nr:TlpA disulfide reductase family protein [Marinicella sp. NBU2979]
MKPLTHTLIIVMLTTLLFGCSEPAAEAPAAAPHANTTAEPVGTKPPAADSEADTTADSTADAVANDGINGPLSFTLTNLDGEDVKAEDYRGQWLVLNYWATWCAPCRDEMPELVQFQAEHDNVQVLGIAYEDAEVEKLKNFAADFNVNYPLLTIDVYNPPAFAEEGGLGLPTTIVYNPEGMRHKKHMGPIDAKGLVEMLE